MDSIKYLPKHYQFVKQVGQGQFGKAYKIRNTETQEFYCAKEIDLSRTKPEFKDATLKEIEILKKLDSQYVVKYIDSIVTEKYLIIIMEYCENGDLRKHIDSRAGSLSHFTETIILNWLLQLLRALKYIHSKNVIHRDIKPENIFLDASATIKIGDFGVSKLLDATIHSVTRAGSACYMSPEIIDGKQYSNKTDVWSLGCVLWQLASLKRPFYQDKKFSLIPKRISEGSIGNIPKCYSELLGFVITKMLEKDHLKRPSISQFLMDNVILDVMTIITKSSQMKQSQLKEELDLSIICKEINTSPNKEIKKQSSVQSSSKRSNIMKILQKAQRDIQEKIEKIKKDGAKAKYVQDFKDKVKVSFQELLEKVEIGFEKLKENGVQSTSNFSSISSSTIKSLVVGNQTFRNIQMEDDERNKGSYEEKGSIMQGSFLGKTIKSNPSLMNETIKSEYFQQTIKEVEKGGGEKSIFETSLKSKYQNTIKSIDFGNTLLSRNEMTLPPNSTNPIANQLQMLSLLGKSIEFQPEILNDESMLQYTMSNAQTLIFTIMSQAGAFNLPQSQAPSQSPSSMSQSIQTINLSFQKTSKQQKDFENSFNRKNERREPSFTTVDREKEMKDIIELYKAQLEKNAGGKGKNGLTLSEIEEVNENSTISGNNKSSMRNVEGNRR